jgi:ribosome-interacting GTPase 1
MVDAEKVSDETIKAILKEYKVNNADICIKCDATEDDIIDIIEGNRKYIPCLYALNKIDAITVDELNILDQIPHYVPIAGDLEWNLDELVEKATDCDPIFPDVIILYQAFQVLLMPFLNDNPGTPDAFKPVSFKKAN